MTDAFISMKVIVLSSFAAIGAVIANILGGWDAPLVLLLFLMGSDFATGLMVATFWKTSPKTKTGTLSSNACFQGICKKFTILIMVWLGSLMDAAMGVEYLRTAVILFSIGNEGLSLLENIGLMGVKYPPAVRKALEALLDKGDKDDKDDTLTPDK